VELKGDELPISPRLNLRNKIRTLGISIARSVWSEDEQGDG
jgi:hypothetical protein